MPKPNLTNAILIVGVTGKAGSGYDTDVAEILKQGGFSIIHSDDAVDDVWRIPEVILDTAKVFGKEEIFENIEDPDPTNWKRRRGVLGELVAKDSTKQERLNTILSPFILVHIYSEIQKLVSNGNNHIAIISTRLARSCLFLFCEFVWYIDRNLVDRRRELLKFYKSRKLSSDYATAKVERTMLMQQDVLEPHEFDYDHVVNHSGNIVELRSIVNQQLGKIRELHKVPSFARVRKQRLNAYKRRGQLLRVALSMSWFTRVPILIERIDGFQREKAMRASLLACVNEFSRVYGGKLRVSVANRSLEYIPGSTSINGRYEISAPLRTSISPMVQTLLPIALRGEGHVEFVLNGCTELKHSAPVNYFAFVFFPLLRKLGCRISVDVISRGFLSCGFGKVRILIDQVEGLKKADIIEKGEPVKIIFSRNSVGIGEQFCHMFAKEMRRHVTSLGFAGQFQTVFDCNENSEHKASSMSVALQTQYSFLGADVACDKVESADDERVAFDKLKTRTETLLRTNAALDPFASDQILLYLALAGGEATIPLRYNLDHIYTQLNLINAFKIGLFNIVRYGDTVKVSSTPMEEASNA